MTILKRLVYRDLLYVRRWHKMDYVERPPTKEEQWNYLVDLRNEHNHLKPEALRHLLDNCMKEWEFSESARNEYLQKLGV